MNDMRENEVLLDVLEDVLNDLLETIPLDFQKKLVEQINLNYRISVPFCFSMSAERDSLPLWNGYGDGGRGVSIGINPAMLKLEYRLPKNSLATEDCLSIHDVIYSGDEQKEILKNILVDFYYNSLRSKQAALHFSLSVTAYLLRFNPIFKTNDFSSEKEWRVIYMPAIIAYEKSPYETSDSREDIFHVFERDVVKVFYPYQIKQLEDVVTDIILGPRNLTTEYEMKTFLEKNGLSRTQVTKSKIPFR